MRRLYTAAQSRAVDQYAIEELGIEGFALMTRAAEAAWEVIQTACPQFSSAVVYAGAGNNAGDGYLLACHMQAAGKAVRVVQMVPIENLQGDARTACEAAVQAGVRIEPFSVEAIMTEDLVVDALLGTGLSRPPEGEWAQAIAQINQAPIVVAVDVPSGLNADTGCASAATVYTQHTATFITDKRGLYTADGPDCAGQVTFCDLAVDAGGFDAEKQEEVVLLDDSVLEAIPRGRRRNSHKGHYGHVLVIGGQAGFQGAVELCAAAALRCGSGRVSLAQPPNVGSVGGMPEVMRHGVENRRELRPLAQKADVLVIGPGMGSDAWAQDMLSAVMEMSQPVVADADALRLLADEPQACPENWVLTPHPGEAGALLGVRAREVQQDRFAAAEQLRKQYSSAIVLKGCGTLVADAGGMGVCALGNPGMATAGMGDVLAGVIASLLGQGFEVGLAARAGVCLHAAAADQASGQGMIGMIASDVFPHLRAVLNAGHAD